VRRFCQALAELAQRMQFLVITHNRETMAIADALYGVSMNQDGVSRLVSLRLPRGENVDGEIAPPPAAALAGRH
jgi:chromosome segregation protein